MPVGRYAPSPSGDLHVGNLRTGLLAWLFAHKDGSGLRLRIDDLDLNATSTEHEQQQLADLDALGISFEGDVLRQAQRFERYQAAIESLIEQGLTYPCYCSRREVREAAVAPHEHLPEGAYPGTCRDLTVAERELRATERPAALRLRAEQVLITYADEISDEVTVEVDDFVVRRNDGVPSYNLATILDDEDQGVEQVVRGVDLLEGTARQIWLRNVLGLRPVSHAHVPLMVNVEGIRLAKRDGAVTLTALRALGYTPIEVRTMLAHSVGLATSTAEPTLEELLAEFDPESLTATSTVWTDPPPEGD